MGFFVGVSLATYRFMDVFGAGSCGVSEAGISMQRGVLEMLSRFAPPHFPRRPCGRLEPDWQQIFVIDRLWPI